MGPPHAAGAEAVSGDIAQELALRDGVYGAVLSPAFRPKEDPAALVVHLRSR